jgi:hypothetical protein
MTLLRRVPNIERIGGILPGRPWAGRHEEGRVAGSRMAGGPARVSLIGAGVVALAAAAILIAWSLGAFGPGGAAAATSSPGLPSGSPAPLPSGSESPPTPAPTVPPPTPVPTPVLVPAPLTGVPVAPDVAARQPIAVMIDDHFDARPQSGFNAASVVWHAPAEGGIPRYMLIFQDEIPKSVGPVRSARLYYVEWAAEWRSLFVHAGGSPDAIATLRAKGQGEWVYDADEVRWGGQYLFRATDRFPPHNVYTDGKHLRELAEVLGAVDEPLEPVWSFAADAEPAQRPAGGTIRVVYPYETIVYRYDNATNRYLRYACPGVCTIRRTKTAHIDRADGEVIAPKNVVILRMRFGPLNDGHPTAGRLEAHNVGTGEAWISSNGVTVKGTWSKASSKAPTLLFGPNGAPISLTPGQTFVQVIPLNYAFDIRDGTLPVPGPSGSLAP